jgi:hypothetical protein
MSEQIGSDRTMRDGEALPEPTDVATASTNKASVAVPHSPLPWRVDANDPIHDADVVRDARGTFVARFGSRVHPFAGGQWDVHNPGDPAFVVRAVNAHQALIDALKEVTSGLDDVVAQAGLCAHHIGASEAQRQWLRNEVLAVASFVMRTALDAIAKAEGREVTHG